MLAGISGTALALLPSKYCSPRIDLNANRNGSGEPLRAHARDPRSFLGTAGRAIVCHPVRGDSDPDSPRNLDQAVARRSRESFESYPSIGDSRQLLPDGARLVDPVWTRTDSVA